MTDCFIEARQIIPRIHHLEEPRKPDEMENRHQREQQRAKDEEEFRQYHCFGMVQRSGLLSRDARGIVSDVFNTITRLESDSAFGLVNCIKTIMEQGISLNDFMNYCLELAEEFKRSKIVPVIDLKKVDPKLPICREWTTRMINTFDAAGKCVEILIQIGRQVLGDLIDLILILLGIISCRVDTRDELEQCQKDGEDSK